MGKTWTLIEVARLLEEEGRFLVGYRESKAAESSHLLCAEYEHDYSASCHRSC